ncbi:glycosyltransferase [Oleiharenicola sp. Vm1]|uniref:glycosyltransferase n=1 Tax=Oleiharenicola sp. Vm1 TaxID=3398393 RepID=UPI0039F6093D
MRLLLTCDPLIPVPPVGYGGIERIVDALIRFYRAAGHEVALLAHAESTAPVDARFTWADARIAGAAATLRNALALRRAVRTFRPDVVHSFSRLGYLLPTLATRQPVVMSYQRHTGGRQLALAARLGGRTLRFTGCSEFICGMGRPQGGEWSAVPNFVELEKLTFVSRVPADAPLVFLSRVDDIKGPDLAIAIARRAGRRLLIAGNHAASGPQAEFFRREVEPHLGRDGVEWIGEVDDRRKNELLGRAAAMIVPIRWNEPFGIVFPEALACGTPVITCARGALPEIVQPGRTGFFITGVDDGVAAVRRLGELDRAACRRDAEERFSLGVVAPRYLELYRSFRS